MGAALAEWDLGTVCSRLLIGSAEIDTAPPSPRPGGLGWLAILGHTAKTAVPPLSASARRLLGLCGRQLVHVSLSLCFPLSKINQHILG